MINRTRFCISSFMKYQFKYGFINL
ncbi:MAG: hypothetical protein LBJ97_03295 [Mycoplasmataceae bacterium]|nr:hypothetical protein [Mycoplasmataceae bacterium]